MKNIVKKVKNKIVEKIQKGFTLVELLAVIVILALIMIIAIPSVLNTLETSRRKTFVEFADKSVALTQKQYTQDQMTGVTSLNECYIYNIETDLDLNNTGSFKGWVLLNPVDNKMYITLYNDNYVLIAYDYSNTNLKMIDYVTTRSSENEPYLTKENLCAQSTCDSCTEKEGTQTITNPSASKAYLIEGPDINDKMRQVAGGDYGFYAVKEIKFTNTIEDTSTIISTDSSDKPVYLWYKDNVIYFGSEANKIYLNQVSAMMFYQLFSVEKIDVSHFYTDDVQYMTNMFLLTQNLKELDLSHFNTSKVTDMRNMFGSTGLTTLDLSSFDTSEVRYMSQMFASSKLSNINVSSFNTANVLDMDKMFNRCTNIETLDLSSFTVGKTHVFSMFEGDTNLKTIYVSNKWDGSKIVGVRRDMVFYNCTSLPGYNSSKTNADYAVPTEQGGYLTLK